MGYVEEYQGNRFVTPDDMKMTPGTLLKDEDGEYWMVRDDGTTALGTHGGVMVDLRRGEVVYEAAQP